MTLVPRCSATWPWHMPAPVPCGAYSIAEHHDMAPCQLPTVHGALLTPLRRELFFALAGLTYYFLTSSSVVALKALSTALLPLDAPYEGLSFAIVSCMGLLATILCASAEGACRCGAPRPPWPSPNCWGDLGASPKIEGLFRRHKVRVCRTENIC